VAALSYRVGGVTVTVDDTARRVTSRWDDGVTLDATPNYDRRSIDRAQELGYGRAGTWREAARADAVWEMTADHDLLHHVLADAAGETQGSVHLRRVATGVEMDEAAQIEGRREERLVMLLHRILNMSDGAFDRFHV
jgi:uncharacterized protein (UPF0548 family)